MKEDVETLVLYEGYLTKSPPEEKSKDTSRWRKRYFRLFSNKTLAYYKDKKSKNHMKRPIDLSLCLSIDAKLVFKKWDFVFSINTRDRKYYLVAEDEYIMKKWVKAICDLCCFKEDPSTSTQTLLLPQSNGRVTTFRKSTSPSQRMPLTLRLSEPISSSSRGKTTPQGTYMLLTPQSPMKSVPKSAARASDSSLDSAYDVLPSPHSHASTPDRLMEYRPPGLQASPRPLDSPNSAPCYDFVPPPEAKAAHAGTIGEDEGVEPTSCYDVLPPRKIAPTTEGPTCPISPSSLPSLGGGPLGNAEVIETEEETTSCYDVLPPAQAMIGPPRPSKDVQKDNRVLESGTPANVTCSENDNATGYDVLPPKAVKTWPENDCNSNNASKDINSSAIAPNVDGDLPSPPAPPRPPKPSTPSGFGAGRQNGVNLRSSQEVISAPYDVLPPLSEPELATQRNLTPSPGNGSRSSGDGSFGGRLDYLRLSGGPDSCYDVVPPPQIRKKRASTTSGSSGTSDETDSPCYDTLPARDLIHLPPEERARLLDPCSRLAEMRSQADVVPAVSRDREETAAQYGLVPPTRPSRSHKKQTVKRVMSVPVPSPGTLLGYSERKAQKTPPAKDGYVDMGSKLQGDSHYHYVPAAHQMTQPEANCSYKVLPPPVLSTTNDNYVHMTPPIVTNSASGKGLPPVPCQTYQGVETIPLITAKPMGGDLPQDIYDRIPARSSNASPTAYRPDARFKYPSSSTDCRLDTVGGNDAIYDALPLPQAAAAAGPKIDRTLKPRSQENASPEVFDDPTPVPLVNRNIKPVPKVNGEAMKAELSSFARRQESNIETYSAAPLPVIANGEENLYDVVPGTGHYVPEYRVTRNPDYVNISGSGDFEDPQASEANRGMETPKHTYINHQLGRGSPLSVSSGELPALERKLSNLTLHYSDVCFEETNDIRKTSVSSTASDCIYSIIDVNATRAVSEARNSCGP